MHIILSLIALCASLLVACSSAIAQSFPTRAVTIVATSAPGAATDVLARAIGQRLQQKWNQPVVVENRPGAAYAIAAVAVAKAAPDGYTLIASELGMFTSQHHLYQQDKRPFDGERDFVPVSGFAEMPVALRIASRFRREIGGRTDRTGKGPSGHDHLRHRGPRHGAASRHAAVGKHGGNQALRGPLSRGRSRVERRDRRPRQPDHDGPCDRDLELSGGQTCDPRDRRRQAAFGATGDFDDCGDRARLSKQPSGSGSPRRRPPRAIWWQRSMPTCRTSFAIRRFRPRSSKQTSCSRSSERRRNLPPISLPSRGNGRR